MWTNLGRLVAVAAMVAAPWAVVTVVSPAVSSAQCADGEWFDPTGKVCRPLGVGPQPLACADGEWWDPTANVCRPLGVGPQPLACASGEWWDPGMNMCRPVLPEG